MERKRKNALADAVRMKRQAEALKQQEYYEQLCRETFGVQSVEDSASSSEHIS